MSATPADLAQVLPRALPCTPSADARTLGYLQVLIRIARAQARVRGGVLCGVHLRLGGLAKVDETGLRAHWEALGDIAEGLQLHVELAPDEPSAVDLEDIELRGRKHRGVA